ncbi:MAG: mechanosensitive ion channel family protein [Proteobacteria bacterium]|nr:mechanosensitive ion channel family protein [Pseudomonadota bacterium]
MRSSLWVIGLAVCLSASAAIAPPPATVELPVPPEQVVNHVSRTTTWYRRINALAQIPVDSEDVVPRDRLTQTALTSLQLAFDFGRAAGALAANVGQPTDAAEAAELGSPIDQAAARMADRIANLQTQVTGVDEQISHAKAKEKQALIAKRAEVVAALDLAKEIQRTVGQIQRFEETSDARAGGAAAGLASQIADLRKSVPEVYGTGARSGAGSGGGASGGASSGGVGNSGSGSSRPAAPASASNTAETFRPESAGIIALFGKWFALASARRDLSDAKKQTDGLVKDLGKIRDAVTKEVRGLANQNLENASTDPEALAQSKLRFQQAAAHFKQVATLIVPLGEQGVTLETAHNLLDEWHDALASRTGTVARYLMLRLAFLLGSVAVVLIISEVWRRATFRYLTDARRRQQFLALRRVLVGLALTLVIVFGLVSEFGSLATYAGLITAGLAVALQNVILAVVAYFFLIGRYGVRVGDRVTLAGVTGRVVEIGLVRIYLMELAGSQWRATGRMVVLSNAVLFQPTAMFKQMPGGDFYWHTITMVFASTTDVSDAEKRLSEAANSVYSKYRPAIEQQHAALQRFIDFQTALPEPEVYARLNIKGLECTVRYPVEPAHAASTDQTMLQALREAQSKAPELKLVDGPLLDTSES